ncbi:hypothetical protein ACHAXS_008716 [Conticribra weissflogii]
MGGDGGTISSSRLYLRGAGKASHTADHPSNALKRAKVEDAERARLILTTCAISGATFDFSPKSHLPGDGCGSGAVSAADIVACPYGKLYKRENALEALLERSKSASGDVATTTLGPHIRGMKDLHSVRFHVVADSSSKDVKKYVPICPITGSEITSGNVPSVLIVQPKKEKGDDAPNVLSERAIKEMGISSLQSEYGPFDEKDIVRLAPPKTGGIFEEIQRNWEAKMEEERQAKLLKKKDKKRKRTGDLKSLSTSSASVIIEPKGKCDGEVKAKKSAADEARSSVQSAVANSSVLLSLFGAGNKHQSDKEKRDVL